MMSCVVVQKDREEAKQALDQLKELGWAKRWSSQPYMSRRTVSATTVLHMHRALQVCRIYILLPIRRTPSVWSNVVLELISFALFLNCEQTSLRELTTLGIKNAENLAIPSVRNDVSHNTLMVTLVGICESSTSDVIARSSLHYSEIRMRSCEFHFVLQLCRQRFWSRSSEPPVSWPSLQASSLGYVRPPCLTLCA
jgi:hypothetical protein